MTENTMTVEQACAEIGYKPEPSFFEKTEKQQWGMIRAKKLEYARRDAVNELGSFVDAPEFASLPANIKDAIKTIAVKRTGGGIGTGGGGARNVFMETLKGYLKSKGDSVDELTLFKDLKMGRGEVRAKIRENLKKAEPKDRFWVVLDEDAEAWTLIGTGAKQPKGWSGAPIEEPTAE